MEEKKKYFRSTPKSKQQGAKPYKGKDGFKSNDKKKDFNKGKDDRGFKSNHHKNFENKSERKFDSTKKEERKEFKPRKEFNSERTNEKKDFANKKSFDNPTKQVILSTLDENKKSEAKAKNTNEGNFNVRRLIFECLKNIYLDKAYSNIEINHMILENNLNDNDKRLLTNVVYGTLQHEKILKWEMSKLTEKDPNFNNKIIILMSLYQLRYLDRMPAFAIINEAVEIAKQVEGEISGKFVNAILREATRTNHVPTPESFINKKGEPDEYEYLSVIYNIPTWVIKMWERHYGKEKTIETLKVSNVEAPLTCRVNVNNGSLEDVLNNYPTEFIKGTLGKNSLIYCGVTPVMEHELFKQKIISIQDESSQYVVEILDPQQNEKILDMCAAPGSKTSYIASIMNNTGKILALDIHEHRVDLMKSYLNGLKLTNTTCICYDSTKLSEKTKLLESFDRVLLDAPCSGLGVVRRKPDILLGLNPDKLDEIVAIQEKLIEQAYKMVKPGGVLLYSTCTINKKENDAQVSRFLANHADMKRIFEKQIFPQDYNSDGFYICKMIKEK